MIKTDELLEMIWKYAELKANYAVALAVGSNPGQIVMWEYNLISDYHAIKIKLNEMEASCHEPMN